MTLVRPNAKVTIDGQTLSAAEAALVWAEIDLAVSGAHDAARLKVSRDSKFASAAPGARVTIAIGDAGSEIDVLTGEVSAPLVAPDGCVLETLSATVVLSRTYQSQTYVSQTVGDIVNDLAGSASIDKVDAPIQLGVYYADNGRSVWTHLQSLAELAGAELGCSASGGLRFVTPSAGLAPARLRYGAELLDWAIGPAPQPEASSVAAHGAGSEAGANKWHWVLRDPVGSGGSRTRIAGGIATRDAAEAARRAAEERAKRAARRGTLLITGDASIRAGDVVELAGVPGADLGPLRVLRVRHRLDSRRGFITRLGVEGTGAGGGPSL